MKKRFFFILLFCLFAGITLITTSCTTTDDPIDQVEEYTVTFNSKGGSTVAAQTVKNGEKATEPADPTRSGYEFEGWYTDETYTNEWEFDVNTVTANVTLYAKWEEEQTTPPAPTTYSIDYESDHGTEPEDVDEATTLPDPLPVLSETGWKFLGWYTSDTYTESSKAVAGATLTSNTTLYAKWEEEQTTPPTPTTYSIDYESDHGTEPQDVTEATTLPDPLPVLSENGWKFLGWYTTSNYTESSKAVAGTTLTANATLYAKWEKEQTPVVTYSITYESDHGTEPDDVAEATTLPDPLPVLSENGWKFLGWYTTSNYTESSKAVAGATLTANTTLYAKWDEIPAPVVTYSITYESDHGTEPEDVAKATTLPNPLPNMFATGWKFLGWYTTSNYIESSKAVAGATLSANTTLYAKWQEVTTHTLTLIIDNQSSEILVNHNGTIEGATLPSKVGYDLELFTDENCQSPFNKSTIFTDDVTLYGSYKIKTYTVTFKNGNTNVHTETVNYNSTVANIPAGPSKTGYNFDGWSTSPTTFVEFNSTTKITSTTTLYASYTIQQFEVKFMDGSIELDKQTIDYNSTAAIPGDPARTGYVFKGWSTKENEYAHFDPDTKITKTTVIYAYFVAEYSVTFNVDGTKKVVKVEENTKVTKPEDPSKSGCQFDGWLYNGATFDFDTLITENIELVAKFTEITASAIEITNSGGYNEGLFFEATPVSGASLSDYSVQYKVSSSSTWKNVDSALIREENNKIRCDIVGLTAGTYNVKVEASGQSKTMSYTVTSYDRSGYAHFKYSSGVGAYDDNGNLKSNAIVVYVTNENKNTVKVGSYTGLVNIIQNQKNIGKPLAIRIIGRISTNQYAYKSDAPRLPDGSNNVSTFFKNSLETTYGENLVGLTVQYMDKLAQKSYKFLTTKTGLESNGTGTSSTKTTTYNRDAYPEVKGKKVLDDDSYFNMLDISEASNITLEGIGTNAEFFQFGLTWKKCDSIEVRNLSFTDYPEDACSFEAGGNSDVNTYGHYWVHNNTFNRGKNNWDISGERDKYAGDGGIDLKYINSVTLSYNKFNNCKKTGLVGGSDDVYTKNVTFHHNYYYNVESRLPLGRQANMHIYNNYYEKCGTCQDIRANAFVFSEANYFDNCNAAQKVTTDSTYKNTVIKSFNDYYNGSGKNSTQATKVTSRTQTLSGNCKPDGKTDYTNFDTNSSLFYYTGSASNVTVLHKNTDVPQFCKDNSGVLKSVVAGGGSGSGETPTTKYSITYVSDHGTKPANVSAATALPNPLPTLSATGWQFLGWYTTSTYTESSKAVAGAPLTKNVTLYAKWKNNQGDTPTSETVTITFDELKTESIASSVTTSTGATVQKGGSSKDIKIAEKNQTINGTAIKKYVNVGGGGNYTDLSIAFTTTKAANITIYYANPGSSGTDRFIALFTADGIVNQNPTGAPVGGSITQYTYTNMAAGNYAAASKGSGLNIYMIVIEYL